MLTYLQTDRELFYILIISRIIENRLDNSRKTCHENYCHTQNNWSYCIITTKNHISALLNYIWILANFNPSYRSYQSSCTFKSESSTSCRYWSLFIGDTAAIGNCNRMNSNGKLDGICRTIGISSWKLEWRAFADLALEIWSRFTASVVSSR